MNVNGLNAIHLGFPDSPVYLKLNDLQNAEDDTNTFSNQKSEYFSNAYDILLLKPQVDDGDVLSKYIKSATVSQKIIRSLPILRGGVSICSFLQPNSDRNQTYSTKLHGEVSRGVVIYLNTENQNDIDSKSQIIKIAGDNGIDEYNRVKIQDQNRAIVTKHTTDGTEIDKSTYNIQSCLNKDKYNTSPIFTRPDLMPVLHSYHRSMDILKKVHVNT